MLGYGCGFINEPHQFGGKETQDFLKVSSETSSSNFLQAKLGLSALNFYLDWA